MADEPEFDPSPLIERLLEEALLGDVPTGPLGRIGRLARTMARTGAALGWRRVRTGTGVLDERLAEELVRSVGALKGVPMKVGQILSYTEESLPPEARRVLATLQTHSPPLPFERVAEVIRAELGRPRADELLREASPRPAAAASIGQVHRSRLPDGTPVAVKVQYPGIEEALEAEFRAAGAGVHFARIVAPAGGVKGYVAEARERVLEECDYERELQWQERFRLLFRDHPVIRIPRAHPEYSSRRVLTSDWMDGRGFEAWLAGGPSQVERDRIGVALYEFYVGTLLRHRIFNADPHPGNYLVAPDGCLVMLDYGCVREFTAEAVRELVALAEAVRRDEPDRIRSSLAALGASPPREADAFQRVRALLRAFFSPTLSDRSQRVEPLSPSGAGALLRDKRTLAELRLPGRFLFLFRIRFGLHAVLARLDAQANWYRLERGWAEAGGSGGRAVDPPSQRRP